MLSENMNFLTQSKKLGFIVSIAKVFFSLILRQSRFHAKCENSKKRDM